MWLIETGIERYSVTIAVRGPNGTWEDISLQSDQNLELHTRPVRAAAPYRAAGALA